MSGVFIIDGTRRLGIGPAAGITYPVTGWTVFFHFQPGSGSQNTAYIYSHNETLQPSQAINIRMAGPGGTIHCRVEDATTTPLESNTSNAVVNDQWNAFALSWTGSPNNDFLLWLNGTQTTHATAATMFSYTPPGEAIVGLQANFSLFTAFKGEICHVAKLDRALSPAEGLQFTSILISPQFAQQNEDFHVEMFNADTFDLNGNRTVSQTSMVYGAQSPAVYPSSASTSIEDDTPPVLDRRRVFFVGA